MEQLQLEEALLRCDDRSFCIVNRGSPRSIVMGISGSPEALVDLPRVQQDRIPLIKRFSGGGTVIVDESTLFVTFIFNKQHLDVAPFPEPIFRWSAALYEEAWRIPGFQLKENDFAIGEKKCGGNAQYIKKDRWLHHTSFLWDYADENMSYLQMPAKRPAYRKDRSHNDFLTRLKPFSPPDALVGQLKDTLVKRFYILDFDWKSWKREPHRKATLQLL